MKRPNVKEIITVTLSFSFWAAIQTETLKIKQKIKAQKEKEKAAYAKMFAWFFFPKHLNLCTNSCKRINGAASFICPLLQFSVFITRKSNNKDKLFKGDVIFFFFLSCSDLCFATQVFFLMCKAVVVAFKLNSAS